jgi:SAM-dependent methyltransferase
MAFLKVLRHAQRYGLSSAARKVLAVFPAYLGKVYLWRVRRCGCCERLTVFLCNGPSAEFRTCLFCSANERYELLAAELKSRYGQCLGNKDVLELDPHSPLRNILSTARTHTRSFYDSNGRRGSVGADGTVCEDITSLTFKDNSFDLIVSSDVLEHVPDLERAFKETARVLRPGGAHLFTVPPRSKTRVRAEVIAGEIHHMLPPEYHLDPLCPKGILAFWDVGPDLPAVFGSENLGIRIVRGPVGADGRVVWMAERSHSHITGLARSAGSP